VIGVVAGGLLRRVESSITHGEIRHGDSTAILVTSASLLVGGVVMYVLGRTGFKFSPRGLGRQRARARF
jgi:membrane protein YqaA with SNARE-associated domain